MVSAVPGETWLPQPADWDTFARDAQRGDQQSTLELYRTALSLRSQLALGTGSLRSLPGYGRDVVAFRNGAVTVILNGGNSRCGTAGGRSGAVWPPNALSGAALPGTPRCGWRP